jgi:uncharacterized protein (DUF58 family)
MAARLMQRAARLRLKALTLADDMKSGSFRSLYRGQGIEFSGVRDYLEGDDVRAIDWNVTARMGKPFIKIFQEERELVTFVILDCSRSMADGTRLATACETSSLIALAGDCGGCPVGAVAFAGDILFSSAPRFGAAHAMTLFSRFDSIASQKSAADDAGFSAKDGIPGSALVQALSLSARLLKKRALVFVISDFRAVQWERPLALLAAKHDVVAVRVTSPLDENLPRVARVTFVDSESGRMQSFPTSSARFRREWREDAERRSARWFDACVSHGAYPLVLSMLDDPFVALSKFFSARGDS